MTPLVYLAVYFGVLVFIIASVARAWHFARLPRHLRWELYPVPHEPPARAAHGGSYFEQTDWWRQPRRPSLLGQWKAMLPEMLFLRGLWDVNRTLWFRSFPFHFGLYLLTGSMVLVAATAVAGIVAPAASNGSVMGLLRVLSMLAGVAGWALSTVGALALLHRRRTDNAVRAYTVPADLFNLAAFVVALGTIGAGVLADRGPGVRAIAIGLITFDRSVPVPPLIGVGLVLGAALVAYIPLTHMSHFIAKYFTYHAVRWDDEANVRGGHLEPRIAEYLAYRPTWAARHVGADGVKDWVAVATSNPAEGAGK